MDEGKDENNKELKPHVSEEVKVESSVVSPVIGLPDVTALHHHHSDSDRRVSQKNDEYESLDLAHARHLDSVYEYTSKIRQFIGLVDPKEDQPVPASSPESEIPGDKSYDASNPDLEKNVVINEKLTDLEQDKNDADLTTTDNVVPTLNIPTHAENDPDVKEPVIPLDDNNKELLSLDVDSETKKPFISEDNDENGQREENETERPRISEKDVEPGQQKSQPIAIEKAGEPQVNNFGSNEITAIDVSPDNDKKHVLEETIDHNLTDDLKVTRPDSEPEDNSLELNEKDTSTPDNDEKRVLEETNGPILADDLNVTRPDTEPEDISPESNEKDTNMPLQFPYDKVKDSLLESEANETCINGLDLNKPESIMATEEDIFENGENNLENEENSDSNVTTLKNEEQIAANLDETENPKRLDEPNTFSDGNEQNTSTQGEGNDLNHLFDELYAISEEQDSCVTPNEIEQVPHFENIRRLSVEIVNKVLDNAETQLRDILNEKRKSNADANNLLERSSDFEIASFSHEEAVKALNSESVNVSHDEDKNNLTMGERESSQLSAQPEVKHNLKNEVKLKEVLAKTYDFNDFQKKIEVEMNKFDPKYDVDPDVVCGMGCFKPRWIQPWATSRVYLILYSIIGILSGSYYSYLIGAISTLEKRFAFKSKTSGYVMMLDEITPLLLGVFIGYFGGKSHRPRMVGFGMLLSSIACFISALPYFIYGPATHLSLGYSSVDNEKKLELCNVDAREGFCDDEDRLPTLTPVLFLMLGSFLKGFGNLAYYAIGLVYMDDNAKKKNTPMYFAIAFSLRLLGPMVGFLMCSFFLKYYENPFVDPGFEPSDPRWIGCWWMGFLVQGVLLLIFTIPISLFPRRLPGTVDYSKSEDDPHLVTSFVGLFEALKRLAKSPVYCLIVLNAIFGIFGSFGHYINLPRYMENQFRLSASTANLISGPPGIGAVMISMTIGGYLIWKFKPGAKFLAAALCASELMQVCAYLILMIPTCQRIEMTSYGFNNDGLVLQNECNDNCNCTTSAFSPVCGPDGASMFFSPCHAGCTEKVNGTYSNCSCVSDSSGQQRDYVTDGFCVTQDCWPSILAYILTMPVVQLIVNLSKVGHTMIFLRSIKPEDKSVALGTFETVICLFGFIPYPIVYGALVDSACLIWEKSCGGTGNCWYYDVPKLNYLLHGTSALFSTFDACTLLAVFFLASRVHDLYKEDYETRDGTNTEKNEAGRQGERKDSNSVTNL